MSATRRSVRDTLRADFAASPSWWSRATLVVFRLGEWADEHRRRRLPALVLFRVLDAVWTRGIVGAEIPSDVRAGPGLGLHHAGRGIVLATGTRIGDGVTFAHGITFAMDPADPTVRAVVGDRVFVGTNAVIAGGVVIGDDAWVGAGAVVTRDVRPGTTVGGVPAREIGPGGSARGPRPGG